MSLDAYLTIGIFLTTIVGLIRFQSRPAVVFGVALLTLVGLNLVSKEQLLSSMSNPGLVTLVLLILCSFALEKTRLLRVIASKVIVNSYNATWLRLFGITALSSAMLNNTAVVATLLSPIRNNPHHFASKLLLPLSYAAILGGTLTLIGTSTNLIVNSLYIDAQGQSLSFFSKSVPLGEWVALRQSTPLRTCIVVRLELSVTVRPSWVKSPSSSFSSAA